MTPTLARMVARTSAITKASSVRHPATLPLRTPAERPLREHSVHADVFGENDTAADAELIALLVDTLRALV